MKTNLYKLYASALLLVCGVSSAYAQGYVDDLYYNKNNESHQRSATKSSRNYSSATSSTTQSSNQPWKMTLANEGIATEANATKSSSDEYYPGMFAEAVGKNNNTQEYKNYDQQSDYQPSWYENTVYVTVVPSWYVGFGFGVNPYYYNPWMASPYYGGYWGNPWYVGYPYYGGGWYGNWYGGGWSNGWYGGGWGYPHYGHHHDYYPPRYTRSNSVYTGQVRGGSSSYRSSSIRSSNTSTRSSTGQYRPSSTSTRSTTGQYRPASTTTRSTTGTVSRPTNTNTNYQYNRSNSNTTTTRPASTATYNRSTGNSTGTGSGSGGGTYNRRR